MSVRGRQIVKVPRRAVAWLGSWSVVTSILCLNQGLPNFGPQGLFFLVDESEKYLAWGTSLGVMGKLKMLSRQPNIAYPDKLATRSFDRVHMLVICERMYELQRKYEDHIGVLGCILSIPWQFSDNSIFAYVQNRLYRHPISGGMQKLSFVPRRWYNCTTLDSHATSFPTRQM
jgi:hypothetical protein